MMMQARGSYDNHWCYLDDLAIGENFPAPPGGNLSDFRPGVSAGLPALNHMVVQGARFFSIDVYTDDLVEIDIMLGANEGAVAVMTTLFCPAVLQHNTIYDLAPPHNKDGFLLITSHLMRLQIRNVSGNIVSPFHLVAKVWS